MNIEVVILAAGRGSRMLSKIDKPLQLLAGVPLLRHVLDNVANLKPHCVTVVVRQGSKESYRQQLSDLDYPDFKLDLVEQTPKHGEGTAAGLLAALPAKSTSAALLVVYADTPLFEYQHFSKLIACVAGNKAGDKSGKVADLAIAGFVPQDDGAAYGRIRLDDNARPLEIIEKPKESLARSCLANSGIMALNLKTVGGLLDKITPNADTGELYLTALVGLCAEAQLTTQMVEVSAEQALGIDSKDRLAVAEEIWQERRRQKAMRLEGARLPAPHTVYFSYNTRLGQDTVVEPHVIFDGEVTIKAGAKILGFSYISSAVIEEDAIVGPFARIRPGAHLCQEVEVGSFVEVKNSRLGKRTKAHHLAYLGDSEIGAGSNIGAGVITCNYDGKKKSVTKLGEGVFVGSLSALIAPVTLGKGAYVGAGSVVTKDVADKTLAVSRAPLKFRKLINKG